jgi:uncharacterized protein YxjI
MAQQIYCPQCGNPSPLGQKFCEKCGGKLPQTLPKGNPQEMAASQATQMPQTVIPPTSTSMPLTSMPMPPNQNYPARGGLFDPSHNFYVLKEKFWDWGSGPIYDERGQQIGKMHRKIFSIRKRIEFQEMDGSVSAFIAMKLVAIRPTYDLHTTDEIRIARISKPLLSIFRPKFELFDDAGNVLFTAFGKFFGWDFFICRGSENDPTKCIGEIHKADRWRDVFLGGLMDFADTYALQIHDPTVDRRLMLGFVIAIDNVLHDT